MISDCRHANLTLFSAFSSVIATNLDLDLQNFVKSHYLYESGRKRIIFLEKIFRALRMMLCNIYGYIYSGSTI